MKYENFATFSFLKNKKITTIIIYRITYYTTITAKTTNTLGKKCPYRQLFCSPFSRIWIEYLALNQNAGKYGTE